MALAIRVAAARLVNRPSWPLRALADKPIAAEVADRLAELDGSSEADTPGVPVATRPR